ncbi:MAG: hypothetical protein IT238_01195 [Bacteroidia bacterium]|nr:hypothetical protein [Bacteroidia bacterium]MCZ2247591.1 hypothetical protein [Bacteroidia bacterium]
MKKIYCLKTCSTCQRIISELNIGSNVIIQDIKTEKISPQQLDEMAMMAGSYEALFSRKALKYRAMELNKKALNETDYKNYILQEYTFLKRPTVIVNNKIFIGSAKSTIEALKKEFNQ